MKIYPAIDLRDGKVVRLVEGDYDRMTVYGDDPEYGERFPLTRREVSASCGSRRREGRSARQLRYYKR